MKIVEMNGAPKIEGLPEGDVVLFFAEINRLRGYCVIFGPKEECLCQDGKHMELWSAKVAFGKKNEGMQVYKVSHGHKYTSGGGMVEIERGQIFFRILDHKRPSTFEGIEIQNVFSVI